MNKYEKWYNSIISKGANAKLPGNERHHILPKSLGGSDDASNLIYITAREHFICHWLLIKIYATGEEHWKMLNALRMMRAENPNQKRYKTKITSRVYARLKEEYSKLQSQRVSGINNPMHGDKFYRSLAGKKRQSTAVSGDNNGSKQPIAREKIALSKLGKKRKPFTEEWKMKLSAAASGKNNSRYGKPVSEETRKKIGERMRGRVQSAEERVRRGAANLGKKREKKQCPHCQQAVAVNGYVRWHGDRCKSKII